MLQLLLKRAPTRAIALITLAAACAVPSERSHTPVSTVANYASPGLDAQRGCEGYLLTGSAPGKEVTLCNALYELGAQYQSAKAVLQLPHNLGSSGLADLLVDVQRQNIIDSDATLTSTELKAIEKVAKYVWQTARERKETERAYARSA